MNKPVNIYLISRLDNRKFNRFTSNHVKSHEVGSLKAVVKELLNQGATLKQLDGFYFSYEIGQIGKEFDLVKVNDDICLNIELKSFNIGEDRILEQLVKNKHYLGKLPSKKFYYFTYESNKKTFYSLTEDDRFVVCQAKDVFDVLNQMDGYNDNLNEMFSPTRYLISPLTEPEKFVNNEYFLTQQQMDFKEKLIEAFETTDVSYYSLTGQAGTGKTLLAYDIAKSIDDVLIVHCGKLLDNHKQLNLNIISISEFINQDLSKYKYLFVDEAQRLYQSNLEIIKERVRHHNSKCLFVYDSKQLLSVKDAENKMADKIESLTKENIYALTGRIRTNKNIAEFVNCLYNLKNRVSKYNDMSNINLAFANNFEEASKIVQYYRDKGFIYINFNNELVKFKDYDVSEVIGQEYDKVIVCIDEKFKYLGNKLKSKDNQNFIYTNLLYQAISRARSEVTILLVNNMDVFENLYNIKTRA